MRPFYFCLCCCLLLSAPVFAQFSRTIAEFKRDRDQETQLLKTQPLLVLLKQEDPKQLKKLAKRPAELLEYQQLMAKGNALLQQAAKVWTLSPTIEVKTEAELDALLATNAGQLNVLDFETVGYRTSPAPMRHSWDTVAPIDLGSALKLPSLRLRVFQKKADFLVHEEPVLNSNPNESDVIYCVKMLETMATHSSLIRTKAGATPPKLLLCQDDRAPGLTDAQIKSAYPYPYEFVSRADFEKAVRDGAPGGAFVRVAWQGYGIISPLAFTLPGMELVCGGELHKAQELLVTLKDFKSFKKTLPR